MSRILLVDDEPGMASLIDMSLEGNGVEVTQVLSLVEAWSALERQRPDIILLDLALGAEDGMRLLMEDVDKVKGIPVVIFSIHDSRYAEAIRLGASSFLRKPFRRAELKAAIEPHLRRQGID